MSDWRNAKVQGCERVILRRCAWCGRPFFVPSILGVSNSRHCTDACSIAAERHYHSNRNIEDTDSYATNIIRGAGVDYREPLAERKQQ